MITRTKLNKLQQPSTWAGLGILLQLFGVNIAPEEMGHIINVATGVAGVAAIFLNEKGVKENADF